MIHHSSRTRRRNGRTIVETAIIINFLLMIMLAVFEYGHIVMMREMMISAARYGARTAVVSTSTYPVTTTAQIQSDVTTALGGQPFNNLVIQVYQADPVTGANLGAWSAAPFGKDIGVQIDADYSPMVPSAFGIIPSSLHLMAKSVMRSEAN